MKSDDTPVIAAKAPAKKTVNGSTNGTTPNQQTVVLFVNCRSSETGLQPMAKPGLAVTQALRPRQIDIIYMYHLPAPGHIAR